MVLILFTEHKALTVVSSSDLCRIEMFAHVVEKRSRVHTTLDITGPAGVVLHLSSFSQPTDTSQNKNVGLLHGEPMSNFTVRVCVISFPAPPCSLSEGERGNRELQTKYEKTHSSEAV